MKIWRFHFAFAFVMEREGAMGKGSQLARGRLVAFSNCGRFGHGNTTSRVPPTSRDPLPLLTGKTSGPLSWVPPLASAPLRSAPCAAIELFEHPHGSGTSRQNYRDIPSSSLRNAKGRQTLEWTGHPHRESGRFAQIDSRETPLFITFERFVQIAANLRLARIY